MPVLTKDFIKEKLDIINSDDRRRARARDAKKLDLYNGRIEVHLHEALQREFKKPETIEELISRLIPINVSKKIINKQAGLYIEAPERMASNDSDSDQTLLEFYEDLLLFNKKQKEANRYFKLFKRNLKFFYLNKKGRPACRNLPRHTYEVFSHDPMEPEIPDTVCIIKRDSYDRSEQRIVFWTDEQHLIVNGDGDVMNDQMISMQNPNGLNPYGRLPFVYTNESTSSVDPTPADDLTALSIIIPLLLSDLAFASKYQLWSIIFIIGYDGNIPVNPMSVVSLPMNPDGTKPDIKTIKPEFDLDKQLLFIEQLVSLLLSTNSMSSDHVKANLDAYGPQSGIAKALDESQSIEDKKDQQEVFLREEAESWNLLANVLIPHWMETRELDPSIASRFSDDFDITVTLREPKVTMSEGDQLKLSKDKLPQGLPLSTLKRELGKLNPDMDDEELDLLVEEILQDQVRLQQIQQTLVDETFADEEENEDEDEQEGKEV